MGATTNLILLSAPESCTTAGSSEQLMYTFKNAIADFEEPAPSFIL